MCSAYSGGHSLRELAVVVDALGPATTPGILEPCLLTTKSSCVMEALVLSQVPLLAIFV